MPDATIKKYGVFKVLKEKAGLTPLEIYAALKRAVRNVLHTMKITHQFSRSASLTGLTAIEMLVTLSIITIVSVSVLLNFSGLNEGAALNRSAQELALGIRQAQNMAFAIRQAQIQLWPTLIPITIPPRRVVRRVGIRLTISDDQSDRFFLFADVDDPDIPGPPSEFGSANNKYDNITSGPSNRRRNEMIINSAVILPRNTRVNSFLCDGSSCSGNPTSVNIIFSAPEATARIYRQPSDSIEAAGVQIASNEIIIELRTPSGQTKTVIVRTNGQISVE